MLRQRTNNRPSHERPSEEGRRTGVRSQIVFLQVTGILSGAPPKLPEVPPKG